MKVDDKIMTKNLFFQAIIKFFLGLILVASLLFVPAGTLKYANGWLFISILFGPMFVVGIIMMIKNPELLKKRLSAKENEHSQKIVVLLSGVMFASAFIVAGLNFRFKWINLPNWSIWIATCIFLAAYLMYAEVLRENTYLSRTIKVEENQKVINSGLYAIVRHPMYSSTLFLFLSFGFILGSPISFLISLFYIPLISMRIKNEERVLEKELRGYSEYKNHVKYKLVPFVW